MGWQDAAPRAGYGLRRATVVACACGLLMAGCLGVGERQSTPRLAATPTATPLIMLEIVTPTPGPAIAPGATPTTAPQDVPAPSAPEGSEARPSTYIVQPGDTLYGIAVKFNLDIQALVDANNISDPNSLQAGQVLVIPTPPAR